VPLLQHVDPIGQVQRELHVLLREQDREPVGLEPRDLLLQVLHDQWGQALRRLVQQEELGVAHEGAGDGEHLLLAPGEEAALASHQLAQLGEQLADPVDRPASVAAAPRRHVQVLPHRELREDSPVLRDEPDPGARDLVGRLPGDLVALPHHPPAARRGEADDAPHGGGLAHPVAPQQAHALALPDLEGDPEQHLGEAVGGVEILHGQDRAGRVHAHRLSPR
jgi:hypothetical protein